MSSIGDKVTLKELVDDPYPLYTYLRREEPVCFVPALNAWLVTRWEDVHSILAQPETFTTVLENSVTDRVCGPGSVLVREGDSHGELRARVDDDYTPEIVSAAHRSHVEAIANRCAQALAGRESAELMSEYFGRVAALAEGSAILGIDDVDADTFARWSAGLANEFANYEQDPEVRAVQEALTVEIDTTLTPVIERLRANPDNSTLSHLLHIHRPAGKPRAAQEVLPTLKLIFLAMREPGLAAGSTLYALLSDPEQMEAVRRDPSLLSAAVREGLRWQSPVGSVSRRTTRPVVIADVEIPAGSLVAAVNASANRDESVFGRAEHFDLHRRPHPHVALGYGTHRCLAADVAPEVVLIALRVLLEHYPALYQDEEHPTVLRGYKFRGPERLHVRLYRKHQHQP